MNNKNREFEKFMDIVRVEEVVDFVKFLNEIYSKPVFEEIELIGYKGIMVTAKYTDTRISIRYYSTKKAFRIKIYEENERVVDTWRVTPKETNQYITTICTNYGIIES